MGHTKLDLRETLLNLLQLLNGPSPTREPFVLSTPLPQQNQNELNVHFPQTISGSLKDLINSSMPPPMSIAILSDDENGYKTSQDGDDYNGVGSDDGR